MPETILPNLGIKYEYDLGADGWKPGVDANFVILDTLAQGHVLDDALTAEPGVPSVGDSYILPTGPFTGANWSSDSGAVKDAVVIFTNIPGQADLSPWLYLTPREGWMVNVRTSNQWQIFNGTAWNSQFILPQVNNAAAPTLAFGDGDTGFYETSDDNIRLSIAGAVKYDWNSANFTSGNAAGFSLKTGAATATDPPINPRRTDQNSGLGSAGADAPNIISGAVEAMRFTGDTTDIIIAHEANVGLTANANSSQGDSPLTSSFNVVSTVGTIGDAVTLPAVFTASNPSTMIYVQNDGANSMDVFPAIGDTITPNAVNIAEAVAAGVGALFIATAASATWSRMRLN